MAVIKTIWKNRRHFKMQIFGAAVMLVVLVFLINLLSIKISYDNGVEEYMSATVKYTSDFQMSLSGVKGTVDNIFVDSSKTQCFVLATLNGASKLTMDANQYQMFLTNTTNDGIANGVPKEQLVGEIYMFGTSGRVGFYFKSDVPFANKMKKITLRSYKKYTANTSPYFVSTPSDAEYDQCHIFFNPGGSSAQTIDFLENHVTGTDFNMSEIYRQINTVNEYEKVRAELVKCQDDMIALYGQMSEYQYRLKNSYNLALPESPDWIKGDSFETVELKNDAGEVVGSYKRFLPATILPGGTNYDWYLGTVSDGYYHLVPDANNMTAREYLLKLSAEKIANRVKDVEFETWYYFDGTEVELAETYRTDYETEMLQTMKGYETLFNNYLELKKSYQTDYLPSLIELEMESETIGKAYTVRRDANTLLLY